MRAVIKKLAKKPKPKVKPCAKFYLDKIRKILTEEDTKK